MNSLLMILQLKMERYLLYWMELTRFRRKTINPDGHIFQETLSHREFLPCVKRDIGCFLVDFDRISHTVKVQENQIVESSEVMDELAANKDIQIIRAPKKYLCSYWKVYS